MLRCKTNSANELAPGGPVSSVQVWKEIFGGAKTINFAKAKSTSEGLTIGRATVLADFAAVARKILQHGDPTGFFCFAGADGLE